MEVDTITLPIGHNRLGDGMTKMNVQIVAHHYFQFLQEAKGSENNQYYREKLLSMGLPSEIIDVLEQQASSGEVFPLRRIHRIAYVLRQCVLGQQGSIQWNDLTDAERQIINAMNARGNGHDE